MQAVVGIAVDADDGHAVTAQNSLRAGSVAIPAADIFLFRIEHGAGHFHVGQRQALDLEIGTQGHRANGIARLGS